MLIQLTSPSRFIIDGEDARQWRIANRRAVPGARFTPAYKSKRWDGYRYPGRMKGRGRLELRRGMLNNVAAAFPGATIRPTFDINQVPRPTLAGPDEASLEHLYDYQSWAVDTGLQRKWGQFAMATNAGKGAIIALLAKAVVNGGGRALVLCDEISVFQALDGEIRKWAGVAPGHTSAGVDYPPDKPIVMAMVPTLVGRAFPLCPDKDAPHHKGRKSCPKCSYGRMKDPEWIDWIGSFHMVLADEADKATADTWQLVLGAAENSTWRLGFSGTFPKPESLDAMVLEESLGPVLHRIKNIELVDRGISAKPLVQLYPYRHANVWRPPRDEWRAMTGAAKRAFIFEQQVIYNQERHHFVASLLEPDVPHAIIVNRIAHGKELTKVIPGAVFLHGIHSSAERTAALERFRAGEFHVLIATNILDRGTNLLGHTVGLIFASGAGSQRQTLQRIGRGLRRAGGKEFIWIKDIIDSGQKYLANASRKRVEVYNDEGFDVRIIEALSRGS